MSATKPVRHSHANSQMRESDLEGIRSESSTVTGFHNISCPTNEFSDSFCTDEQGTTLNKLHARAAITESNELLQPIDVRHDSAFISMFKDTVNTCQDINILEIIQEFLRQRLNLLALEQKKIKHVTTQVKKVGKYTYRKKQTKEGCPAYWYIHFSEHDPSTTKSRTVTRYLGKNLPTFKPKTDLQRSNRNTL